MLRGFSAENVEDIHIQFEEYGYKQYFSYMKSSETGGIAQTVNPVIIYQNSDKLTLNGERIQRYAPDEIIFQGDKEEINDICKKYGPILGEYTVVQTNVYDAYIYNHNFIVKLISFLSSLCVLVLLLDIAVIVATNKMEYRTHALEISLKKVLGYSLFERHKKLILRNIFTDVVTISMLGIASLFMSHLSMLICIITGLVITGIELAIILKNIILVEKQNIQKALKGGCL
jgi:hypothetical protein